MNFHLRAAVMAALVGLCGFTGGRAEAQTIYFDVHSVAMRSGESLELGQVYAIGLTCKSLLTAKPEVEIMDGPPGVTAFIRDEPVVPRSVGCAKPVDGGKLLISTGHIDDYSKTRMVLRIKMKTKNGDRQYSRDVNVTLFP